MLLSTLFVAVNARQACSYLKSGIVLCCRKVARLCCRSWRSNLRRTQSSLRAGLSMKVMTEMLLLQWCMTHGVSNMLSNTGPLSQLPQHIVSMVNSVKTAQQQLQQGQAAQARQAEQHLQTLRDLDQGLVTLLRNHKLGTQQVGTVKAAAMCRCLSSSHKDGHR